MTVGPDEARELAWLVTRRAVRERLAGRVAALEPATDVVLPAFLRPLVDAQAAYTAEWMQTASSVRAFPAMFRGFRVADWTDWWQVYFYRFADPEARMGPATNYADRIRGACASVLPSGATIYMCPPAGARAGVLRTPVAE